jgi:S1-C subfamily serine protease
MNEPAGDQFSWSCPSCGRRVPTRFDECRCGFHRHNLPPAVAEEPAPEPASSARSGPPASLLLILGAAIGLGIAVYIVRSQKDLPGEAVPAARVASAQADPGEGRALSHPPEPVSQATSTFVAPVTGNIVLTRPSNAPADPTAPVPASGSIEDLVGAALPAVASIDAGNARGSGFFVRPDIVVTNEHVISGQSSVQVYAGGAKYTARVVSASVAIDLAVLQVYSPNPQQRTLRLGSTAMVRPGQEVIAIGNALGAFSNTVTRGIVSAVRKTDSVTLIQTDAAINPGNSGGPLLDRSGTVIGINSMGISRRISEGLGFAIAIEHATQLLNGRVASSFTTPGDGLNQLLGGPSSEGEALRAQGASQYEKTVAWAAHNGDDLDSNWQRNARLCVASATQTGGDRAWFALYVPNGIHITQNSTYNCVGWIDDMKGYAKQIKDALDESAEVARRGGVYPGTIRQIRQRYKMDWSGWDR